MPTERVAPSARCFSMRALDHFENGLEHAADRRRSAPGQSLLGRASSNSGHVRYAPKAEESSLPVTCLCRLMASPAIPMVCEAQPRHADRPQERTERSASRADRFAATASQLYLQTAPAAAWVRQRGRG